MTDVDVWAQRIAAFKADGATDGADRRFRTGDGDAEPTGADAVRRVLRIEADAPRAAVLLADGYVSAHHVTARARSLFVRQMGSKFGLDGDAAALRLHQKAALVQSRVAHMIAMLRGTIGSPQARALTGRNIAPEIEDYSQKLDNYQTLFGSLAYCSANGEATILSPAAYLADLLRVIDLAITQSPFDNFDRARRL